ncbi:MAG: hypothetical protein H8E34_07165 [Bacteroidetes bacterium]|nr:hypothetical protein [Bacteroidota bacterium]MBL6943624.1 hypothetical protein [Bacteroidales bacterium]
MKKHLRLFYLLLVGVFFTSSIFAQCTPEGPSTCPDPEDNGQICPDSIPNGQLGLYYDQTITILAPPEYDTGIIVIPLHHLHIKAIDNLPPGITWLTNAADSNFMVGTYYCVLLSGIPADTGTFFLKIVVDVFADFSGIPVFIGTTTDSTSVFLKVTNPSGIFESMVENQSLTIWPNPFINNFHLGYQSLMGGTTKLEIYNMMGQKVFDKEYFSAPGENTLTIDGNNFRQKHLILKLNNGNKVLTGIVSRKE